jgi:endonuclease/exonuclease/phosphatase family metal-dependent hydrolase
MQCINNKQKEGCFMKKTKMFLLLIAMLSAITLTAWGGGSGGGSSATPAKVVMLPVVVAEIGGIGEEGSEEGKPPIITPDLNDRSHIIHAIPDKAGPGADITIQLDSGPDFVPARSKVSFHFSNPLYLGNFDPVPTTSVSPTQLTFRVPQNAGCGDWKVVVMTTPPRRRVGAANLKVTDPCIPPPQITGLSVSKASPGARVTVSGRFYRAGAKVTLHRDVPRPSWTETVSANVTSPTQLQYSVPSSDPGCGTNTITVNNITGKDMPILPSSNAVRFHYSCPPNTLSLLTYNVQMRPDTLFNDKQAERAPLIGQSSVMDFLDVVIFQEAFDDKYRSITLAQRNMAINYPYRTRILGSDGVVEQDGGVIILSKWPIENCPQRVMGVPITIPPGQSGIPANACGGIRMPGMPGNMVLPVWPGEQRLFGDTCSGVDCLADKGVLYARINKEGRRYHVFGTHLNAGSEQDGVNARKQQLEIINKFIGDLKIPANEPVIIAGDLNLPVLGDIGGGNPYTSLYAVGLPPSPSDPYPRVTTIGGSQLDYIMYSRAHLAPLRDKSFSEVRFARGGPSGEPYFGNLSDHHPLFGRFVFPTFVLPPIKAIPFTDPKTKK